MSITKELIEQERQSVQAGLLRDIHLHQEGSFLRAYDWSAWLSCRYLHEFKVNKRVFKGIDEPVAYIGFPETSLNKWIPEGAVQTNVDEKHLSIHLPEPFFAGDTSEVLDASFVKWKDAVPLSETQAKVSKNIQGCTPTKRSW